ncbi:hypothetical protein HYH03_018484 [Edaphochlamys debaryana]|uniref:Cyclin N-terminal domain-containing protein n=1 Tax=Edaphochlamys debaryana TaxID=47281 RepID=A0A835XK74_9CHLO|nr:hypothetical protein HYH03_018484 [Edaphochlamys debaryana]|eukprot:KAG2482600.1 hypothetical protein HYH03_018484 [Edaphochlamys debaryana]
MEAAGGGSAKRSASPYGCAYAGPEASKRCRPLAPGQNYLWNNKTSNKAQLNPALRRVQSAPVGTDTLEQQTWDDLEHWRGREATRRPCPDRMGDVQTDVTPAMRTMLVDWLGEVRDEFRLHTETLFLAVHYLDRYLCAKPVSRGRFQLLGLTCLWVAAKFEEVYPPALKDMLAMAENMYSAEDMRVMEKELLFTLDFGLSVPTPLRFLHYFLQLAPLPAHPGDDLSARRLAEALLELTLLEGAFLRAPPSHVAAAAVYLALGLVRHHEGLQGVVLLSGAEPTALGELVKALSKALHSAASQPQPCALLLRYRAWEGLHGSHALAIAAATAAAPTSSAAAAAASAAQAQAQHPSQPSAPQTQARAQPHPTQAQPQAPARPQAPAPHSGSSAGVRTPRRPPGLTVLASPGRSAAVCSGGLSPSPGRSPGSGAHGGGADRCVLHPLHPLAAMSALSIAPTAAAC